MPVLPRARQNWAKEAHTCSLRSLAIADGDNACYMPVVPIKHEARHHLLAGASHQVLRSQKTWQKKRTRRHRPPREPPGCSCFRTWAAQDNVSKQIIKGGCRSRGGVGRAPRRRARSPASTD
eukprot:568395-Prorocentrum_minimum.AAC.2